jgi:hypothetical protein
LEQAFRASTPGKRTATLAEQNAKLQAQLDEVLDMYHNISQRPTPTMPLAHCPRCHGTKLLRNGRFPASGVDAVIASLWPPLTILLARKSWPYSWIRLTFLPPLVSGTVCIKRPKYWDPSIDWD